MNDELAEAHSELERALVKYLHLSSMLRPGDMLTTWATVACLQNIEDERDVDYVLALAGGMQPAHVTAGLMQAGMWCVDGTYELERGDDT